MKINMVNGAMNFGGWVQWRALKLMREIERIRK